MAQKTFAQVSFFSPEFIDPGCLGHGSVPWVMARHAHVVFPPWLLRGWCKEQGRGRDAWPAVMLMILLVLRFSEEGMSRRAAVARAAKDMNWRAAMGLPMGGQTPSETTVRRFESWLRQRDERTGVLRYLLVHEQVVRLCLQDEKLVSEAKWATDSTPMWCYGAVRDTVRLLGDGLRMLVGRYARLTRRPIEQLATQWQLPLLTSKSVKGHYAIDWSDADQRAQVIETLAGDVVRVVDTIRGCIEGLAPKHRKDILQRCARLLRVVHQDLELDETGRMVVARRVAEDRLISLTDPQARHGRKSKSQTFNGFKTHAVGDVISGLIAAIAVTSGNQHDSKPACRLIRRAKDLCEQIDCMRGDTAYGGAELRYVVKKTTGVTLISPPPPTVEKDGRLTRKDFDINLDTMCATCPNGVQASHLRHTWSEDHGVKVPVFSWSVTECGPCPKRQACMGTRQRGQIITLHAFERELREAREAFERPEVRREYRTRSQCERLMNEVTRHGGRQARSFGLAAAQLQAHVIAMRCNLGVFAKLLVAREAQKLETTRVAA